MTLLKLKLSLRIPRNGLLGLHRVDSHQAASLKLSYVSLKSYENHTTLLVPNRMVLLVCLGPVPGDEAESSPSDTGPVTLPCESGLQSLSPGGNWPSSGAGNDPPVPSLAGPDLTWEAGSAGSAGPALLLHLPPFPAVAVTLLSIQGLASRWRVGCGDSSSTVLSSGSMFMDSSASQEARTWHTPNSVRFAMLAPRKWRQEGQEGVEDQL